MSKNNIWIVCPFYNEEKHVANMYKNLVKTKLPFIMINDGSTDKSYFILQNIHKKVGRFKLASYGKNKGKGFAIKEGAKITIHIYDADYVLIMDSDGQNRIEDISQFLTALKMNPKAHIIIGNRLHNPKGMPILRYLTNRFMSGLISLISGQYIADSQCGMRLLHKSVFDLETKEERFAYESEQLVKASRAGMEIVSVPIKCIYDKNRISKMNYLSDTIRFFKMILKLLFIRR